jgi:hypothetical protein
MTNEQLYSAIFHRKSVRKYDPTPLPDAVLTKLRKFTAGIRPLDRKLKYELTYLGADDVKNLMPVKAPHYICLYSENKDNYLMNAGFLLQQIDLYLSSNDLGSCWLGMAKPAKSVPSAKNGMEFVIMLAFGQANEPLHRADSSEFKREKMSAITDIKGADELLEPVRLAPSASNTQVWYFSGSPEEITVGREKLNILKAPMYGKVNQIDIGIALCHLYLSADHLGKRVAFDFTPSQSPRGYEFMAKVRVVR